ncbi:MAG: caspase family protein [Proteobacteria bacterium]|nr:caspase family protein [Pseudomonadota bacterium]MCP4917044.1 caspase family protein [Pseudomonadota bacterium]
MIWLVGAALAQDAPSEVTAPQQKRYAVVVGLSQYASMPEGFGLESAHGDAARVALALREEAGFADVRLITDAEATRERIEAVFRDDLSGTVGSDDLVLIYFVGHGVGGDFDDPYLLTHDTSPDDLPGTALSVKSFGESLPQWLQAGSYAIVTDAAHDERLGELALVGPVANSWPDLGSNTMLLSATSTGEFGAEGVFSGHFIDAITGGADTNKDGTVTAAELHRYVLIAVPRVVSGQNPAVSGKFDAGLPLSSGVTFKETLREAATTGETQVVVVREQVEVPAEVIFIREQGEATEILPTHTVDKVKFVMKGLASPTVACREQSTLTCDPTCYAREVLAGPCTVSGFDGNFKLSGSVFVAARGVYECEPEDGLVVCKSPSWGD